MKIHFVLSVSGKSYFEEFLSDLNKNDKALILAVFANIGVYGFKALGCDFRQVDNRLWEIKIRNYRFFYFSISADSICIIHSYKKQSQKAPYKEINLAKKRMLKAIK